MSDAEVRPEPERATGGPDGFQGAQEMVDLAIVTPITDAPSLRRPVAPPPSVAEVTPAAKAGAAAAFEAEMAARAAARDARVGQETAEWYRQNGR